MPIAEKPTPTDPTTRRALTSAEVVFTLNYFTPERRFVYVDGQRVAPTGDRPSCVSDLGELMD